MLNSQRVKVSKETVVLRRWGQFGYINQDENANWPPQRATKPTFRALAPRQSEGL